MRWDDIAVTQAQPLLDLQRIRELFDVRSPSHASMGGDYEGDPYPVWSELRESGPVHAGTLHDLTGFAGEFGFHGLPFPDRPHYTAFSFAACDTAYRNPEVFASSPDAVDFGATPSVLNSLLSMGGTQHRRYRGLVQPSFVPAKAQWWIRNWIEETVNLLVDVIQDSGRADLNVDFCAAIPVLTITGSFGIAVDQALEVRAAMMTDPMRVIEIIKPVVAARRERPEDDLISVLVQAELKDEDGTLQVLSDAEIFSFTLLLLAAGSGTTWKQMGITLTALLERPEVLRAVREDRSLLRPAIEEALRWQPTDPMFSRWVTQDTELHGVAVPKGSVLHICLGAANRDPLRWESPEQYDISRAPRASFAFGGGAHICLGMHVARAEMLVGIGTLLDRLPDLRLDPAAEAPTYAGFYERGVSAIPVLFGSVPR